MSSYLCSSESGKNFTRLFLFVLVAIVCCSTGKYTPRYYSRDNLQFNQLPSLYENTPFFQDSIIYHFIIELHDPELPEDIEKQGIVGTVIGHPVIDESGNLQAVYIKEPLHPVVDEAVIQALKLSRFRTRKEVTGDPGTYSLIIPFQFYHLYQKDLNYFFRKDDKDSP